MNSPVLPIAYEPYYTPGEVAAIVKCCPRTMRTFFERHPECIVINPGSKRPRRRIPKRAVDQLLKQLKVR